MNDYPNLFRPTSLGIEGMTAQFEQRDTPPPMALISNINCVPFVGAQCAILSQVDGRTEIPGGTLEPGEDYETALRRELREEAGARLLRFGPVGAWHTRSALPQPSRPHLPHPESYRYVVYGEIELTGKPSNPAGAEPGRQLEGLPVAVAAARFRASGRRELAELYQLAARIRSQQRQSTIQIDRLDHVVLTVRNLDRAIDFYTRVLGMQAITFGEGRRALRFGQQKINLHLAGAEFEPKAAQPTPGSADVCFITQTPLADVARHLERLSVPIEAPPGTRSGALGPIQSVYVRDPDGNLIELSNYDSEPL